MNEVQRCRVERVIREVLAKNKDKSLNEIKRLVKDRIRIKRGNSKEIEENMQLISEIDFEFLERVITENEGKTTAPTVYVIDGEKKTRNKGR